MAHIQNRFAGLLIFCCLYITACKNDTTAGNSNTYDTPQKGAIYISVDETFKPVISEQIKVYQSTYPDAHIVAAYKSEADCLRDLQKDSTRMIIVAKDLSRDEKNQYEKKLSYRLQNDILAYDAVSVVVNNESKDSVFTLKKLKALLTDSSSDTPIVVDGNNATSTVRYLIDSVLKGKPFGKNVSAANGSRGVIDYVTKNKNAVGFVGSSWVGNIDDPEQIADGKFIKTALVECLACTGKDSGSFARPSPESISHVWYPLVRPLHYFLKENSPALGTGFAGFMALERGQLIFRRAYLVPGKIDLNVRKSDLDTN